MTATITINSDLSAVVETDDRICHLSARNPLTQRPWANEAEVQAFAESIQEDQRYMGLKPDPKIAVLAAVKEKLNTALTGGFTVPGSVSTALSGKVLQTRDAEDRTNWLVSHARYTVAVAAGQGAVVGANFRTEDNQTITVSFSEGLDVLLAMAAWGAANMANSWALKDAVDAAADQAALDAIDIEAGWV